MYGKIFVSMYDGTLAGNWKALVTFQQMIVLCDPDGILDITPKALSQRTGIPLDIIEEGISLLEQPDPYSRSQECDGRRIERIDDHRPWGWHLVNHKKYKDLISQKERREYQKYLMRNRRKVNVSTLLASVSNELAPVSSELAMLGHTDTDTDTKRKDMSCSANDDVSKHEKVKSERDRLLNEARAILEFLNTKTHRKYRPVPLTLNLIKRRLSSGVSVDDCKSLIAKKCRDWQKEPRMEIYLRPKTLFAAENFENYLGELKPKGDSDEQIRTNVG